MAMREIADGRMGEDEVVEVGDICPIRYAIGPIHSRHGLVGRGVVGEYPHLGVLA